MKRFVNFFKDDRLWQMLVALFFAVVLFFTAWSGNTQNKNNSSSEMCIRDRRKIKYQRKSK